jgi:hypothetical protein
MVLPMERQSLKKIINNKKAAISFNCWDTLHFDFPILINWLTPGLISGFYRMAIAATLLLPCVIITKDIQSFQLVNCHIILEIYLPQMLLEYCRLGIERYSASLLTIIAVVALVRFYF